MNPISRCAKGVAFVLLTLIALYSGYYTTHLRVTNEYVLLSRAAALVPFSGFVGETVLCAYGRFWSVDCSGIETAALHNLSIRYLCPVHVDSQHFDCIDKNMVGIATILTLIGGVVAAAGAAGKRGVCKIASRRYLRFFAIVVARQKARCCYGN